MTLKLRDGEAGPGPVWHSQHFVIASNSLFDGHLMGWTTMQRLAHKTSRLEIGSPAG